MDLSNRFRNVVAHGIPNPSGKGKGVVEYFRYLDAVVSAVEDVVAGGDALAPTAAQLINLRKIINHGVPHPSGAPRFMVEFFEGLEARVLVLAEELVGGEEDDDGGGDDGGGGDEGGDNGGDEEPDLGPHEFELTGFGDKTFIRGDSASMTGSLAYRGEGFLGTMTLRQVGGPDGGLIVTTSGEEGNIIDVPLGLDWDPEEDWGTTVPLDVQATGDVVGTYKLVFTVETPEDGTLFTSDTFTVSVAPV